MIASRLKPATQRVPRCGSTLLRAKFYGMAIALSCIACASVWPTVASSQPTGNDYYASRGTELLQAVEKYHLGPGDEKLRARSYESAFGDFKFILNYFPNHPQALLLMAQLCEAWKSPKCVAQEYFELAIARNSNVASTFVVYGIYLDRIGKIAPAIESFNRALTLDADSVNANYNIALAYLDNHQYELANRYAQKAYALGAPLPGLRDRLMRSGHWNPQDSAATLPQNGPSAKGAGTETPPASPEKAPAK